MCASIGLGTIISGVSGIFGAMSSMQQASDQAAWQEYNAAVMRNNAIMKEDDARDATLRGNVEAEQHRQRIRQAKGSAAAAMGAMGQELGGENSSADLLVDIEEAGEMDIQNIYAQYARENRSNLIQASNYRAQATGAQMQADSARSAGSWNAFGTLLGAASKFKFGKTGTVKTDTRVIGT